MTGEFRTKETCEKTAAPLNGKTGFSAGLPTGVDPAVFNGRIGSVIEADAVNDRCNRFIFLSSIFLSPILRLRRRRSHGTTLLSRRAP
ncbi:hypothetical protein [Stieleria sp.]|uniref:hypothetical protein n=1 Tax=Stieleria sp. TaxID=2795976 RepID=UPI003566EF2E